jgi:hypothetical protein
VVGFLLAAVATAWSALAADVVVESTLDTSDRLVLFGRTLAVTTPSIEVFGCVGLAMSVAIIATASIGGAIRRRHETQLRGDVDRRWEEISMHNAGMEARNELLQWRLQDLQEQIDTLAVRRDELLADSSRDLDKARETVRASRSREALRRLQHGVIALPDLEDQLPPAGGDDPSTPRRRDEGSGDNVRRFPA